MVFASPTKKSRHILILNQEAEVRPNQSEIAFRIAIEDLINAIEDYVVTTLHYMHTNPRFSGSGKETYIEADSCEVNLSKVQLFTHDEKFMNLIHKRMYSERINNFEHGMKIEQRGDEIYIVYPPIH